MAVTLNASTSTGLVQSADTSGEIQLQSNGTTELTVTSTGVTVADNLLFNSGYGSAATAYGCRAWVNFNGTGTVAIRASGNVSSITDNGTGDYTINFTNAMPDANYSFSGFCTSSSSRALIFTDNPITYATGSLRISAGYVNDLTGSTAKADPNFVNINIFR